MTRYYRIVAWSSIAVGVVFLGLSLLPAPHLGLPIPNPVIFGAAMVCAGAANSLAFVMLGRMSAAGFHVGLLRWHKDFQLYSEYWRIAPSRGWSRTVPIGALLSFVAALVLLLASAK